MTFSSFLSFRLRELTQVLQDITESELDRNPQFCSFITDPDDAGSDPDEEAESTPNECGASVTLSLPAEEVHETHDADPVES